MQSLQTLQIRKLMQGKQERIHYLDWLRVLAVLGVFYAHSAYIFTMFYWHSQSNDRSVGLLVIQNFISQWGMSLFFLLSGASTWFALRSRTGRQFIGERFKRLIIPFVVGCILLSPPEAYFEALSRSLYHGPFIQFYPYFFRSISPNWHLLWLRYYGYHLWFLVFLFTFSAIALPLFFSFKNLSIQCSIAHLAAFTEMPGGIFLFALPIALIQMALRPIFPLYEDWADFFGWLIFFLYGYVLFSNPRFGHAIEKQGKIALLTGIICAQVIVALWFTGLVRIWETTPDYSAGSLLYQFLRSLTG